MPGPGENILPVFKKIRMSLISIRRKQESGLRWILRMLDQVGKTIRLDKGGFIVMGALTCESGSGKGTWKWF